MDASSGKRKRSESVNDYQVFLSFRGPDTRYGFTDVLYERMTDRAGIRVFKDDDEISAGQPIAIILQAIENSEICVVILSKDFASSPWCLREVEKMVELDKEVIPIFFKISPNDVKLKTPLYAKAMAEHELKYGKDQVEKWKSALKKIAKIKGMEVSTYTRYTEFCKEFTEELYSKLKPRKRWNTDHLVGMDRQIKSVMNLMDMESSDVLYIGIHGMGGIGKTTLARAIFQRLSANFDCSCFLEGVRESSLKINGLQDLRRQLQERLDPEFTRGCNSFRDIEERFQKRKVLIVLDDVDKSQQVEMLAGQCSWFGSGSRIIVTSRNTSVLKRFGESNDNEVRCFKMCLLNSDEALELFQFYAFRKERPLAVLETISREIASISGGLPLALKVIGSLLYNIKDEAIWGDLLEKLKSTPLREVKDTLRISYDALEDEQKEIFLDIACFPAMEEKQKAVCLWAESKFFPLWSLEVLSSMSLVKIVDDEKIWMHDLLKDLGKDIVREESNKEPGKRSRVWKNEDAREVLLSKEGKEKVEALYIDKPLEVYMTREHFASFLKLRFLHLVGSDIEGDLKNLLPSLTWFSWRLCPPVLNVTNLCLKNLVILDLSFSLISESWGGWGLIEILSNLKVLDLSNCHKLTRTPDFSKTNRLERLDLHDCIKLRVIHGSIGKLQMLKYLNLVNCCSLEGLPDEIGCLVNLEKLQVSRPWGRKFKGNFSLPSTIGHLESLLVLRIEYMGIVDIPYSIGGLSKLEVLSLQGCSMIEDLPDSFGNMESLKELNLSSCRRITEWPDSIGGLVKLERLVLHGCSLSDILPESLGLLQELKVLKLGNGILRKLPVSIKLLKRLEVIEYRKYSDYSVLEELPMEIGSLSSLRKLMLSTSSISTLPSTISQLTLLEELDLEGNHHLQELSDLPLSLRRLHVSSKSLHKISDFSRLVNLTELRFLDIDDYRWPPQLSTNFKCEGIEELTKLWKLELSLANATTILQSDRGSVPRLEQLIIDFRPDLALCSLLPYAAASSLELVGNSKVRQVLKLPDLSSLSNLSHLEFKNWYIKDGIEGTVGIQYLWSLTHFTISNCGIEIIQPICLLKNLRYFCIKNCGSIKMLPDLSEMKNLKSLCLQKLKLVEIYGLGNLKSLEMLSIFQCYALQNLENLSKLIMLSVLQIVNCPKLRTIEGTEKLMLSRLLYIYDCTSLQNVDELKKRSKRGSIDDLPFVNFL